jgi:hypothetical protein
MAARPKSAVASETHSPDPQIELGLNAAIVTVREGQPHILVVRPGIAGPGAWDALPFGLFAPRAHRTLEIGLREWVKQQTGLELGYVEQLYTFGDRGRHAEPGGQHMLSVGYLALTRETDEELLGSHWSPWYAYFPWEDWRKGKPEILSREIEPRLEEWAARPPLREEPVRALRRAERLRISFGMGGGWDEEKVLERYELMYEAGLVAETRRDRRALPSSAPSAAEQARFGEPMQFDHRRILATSMGRLRGKLKYRPVVFELMEPTFTLLELQRTVEAISGVRLHKQNFRRLVETNGLVERTGRQSNKAGGRPAEQFRFRREVLRERPSPGVKVRARG